jgi:aspartyl-tRNA(Asn)/glutamyl-tRNA(Gln) amidotransferase subunit A
MGFLHLGSDAGGSVRIPASFSGCVGFKPSPGLVPSYPASLFSGLSASGPLVRYVEDAALMLDIITQYDARDWHTLPLPPPHFTKALKQPLKKLRVAYATSINDTHALPDVKKAIRHSAELLSDIGHVEEIELNIPHVIDVFNKHWMAVASFIVKQFPTAMRKKLDPRFLHWASRGDSLSLHDYLKAERDRMTIGEAFKNILDTYDVLITPTTAMTAFEVAVDMPTYKGKKWDDWSPFTYPANLAKLPAVSLPIGLDSTHLPMGLQIMGGYLKDSLVLQVAKAVEERVMFQNWIAQNLMKV